MNNYLQFHVGNEDYIIPLQYVMEVLQMMALHDVPDESILGMMTLRNRIIPVIDIHPHLKLTELDITVDTPIIVLNHNEQYFGVVVDEIHGVTTVDTQDTPPENQLICRTLNQDSQVIFELNIEHLLPNTL